MSYISHTEAYITIGIYWHLTLKKSANHSRTRHAFILDELSYKKCNWNIAYKMWTIRYIHKDCTTEDIDTSLYKLVKESGSGTSDIGMEMFALQSIDTCSSINTFVLDIKHIAHDPIYTPCVVWTKSKQITLAEAMNHTIYLYKFKEKSFPLCKDVLTPFMTDWYLSKY